MARPIVIDPFFDRNPMQRGTAPSGYGTRTAADETFSTVDTKGGTLTSMLAGRPLAAVLPTGTTGGKGKLSNMLVSPHTEGGTPQGFHPNRLDNVRIQIDPQINGDTVHVSLGHLRAAAVQQAFTEANEVLPSDGTIERYRLRASAAYHALADEGQQTIGREAPAEVKQAMQEPVTMNTLPDYEAEVPVTRSAAVHAPAPTPSPATSRPRTVQSWGSPMAALRQPAQPQPQSQGGLQPHVVDTTQQHHAPTKHVLFELELMNPNGTYNMQQEAWYHDVLHIDGFVILVWDTRCTTTREYTPPEGPGAPPTALMLDGDPNAYLVHATPIRYVHNHYLYRVLIIDKVAPTQ